jgi:predicted secreted protein
MNCLYSTIVVALSVLLCTIGVQGKGPCLGHYPLSLRPFAGVYVPQCTPFGYFKVVQVHGSTGHSWCVNPENGVKVESSDVAPGAAAQPQCGKCFYELAKFYGAGHVSVGRTKPQCDDNGLFAPLQSSGSTGYSWCVNPETGDKIEGSDAKPGAERPNCGEAARQTRGAQIEGPCTNFKKAFAKRPIPGHYDPQCTPFGLFNVVQFDGSTGYRACVHPLTGDQIEGSELAPGDNRKIQCGKCLYALGKFHAAQAQFGVMIGAPYPQCDAQGLYTAKQSSGSTGYSWCVDPTTGEKIEGSDVAPGQGQAECHARETRGIASGPCITHPPFTLRPPGQFTPKCTVFGYFQVVQSHASTGYSWCVNPETGIKIEGSEIRGVPQCGKCLSAILQFHSRGHVSIGLFKPTCDAHGHFNPTQSSGSTGYSWCVDPETGDKIEGTDVAPGQGQAECHARETRSATKGPCKKLPIITLRPPGHFSPKCTKFGFFEVAQLHPSTGYRWCVNPETGEKIEGSELAPSDNRLLQCGKCLSALLQFHSRDHMTIGGFKPLCDAQGRFNKAQYSSSTGYVWCVDPETGDKIEGSEVKPGPGQEPRLTLDYCLDRPTRNSQPFVGPCTKLQNTPVGHYVPKCTELGLFEVQQTHPSTGYRWCVNPLTGDKVEGSELSPADNRLLQCGKCLTDLAAYHERVGMFGIGGTPPQCDAHGRYNALQVSGGTGYQWCVDPETGDKIEGTEIAPGHGRAHCEGRQKRNVPKFEGPCTKLQPFSLRPVGQYVPQCTQLGLFEVVQRHPSTGYRWCVKPLTGEKG